MTITTASNVETAAQEARETAAQTKAEAQKGDQQAVRKLAQTAAPQTPAQPPISAKGLDATA